MSLLAHTGEQKLAANYNLDPTNLKNNYYAMRHGESFPNTKKIISCAPKDACSVEHGLTNFGKEQVRKQAVIIKEKFSGQKIKIISSDFSRAWQTAKIVKEILGTNLVKDARLRERNFGKYHNKKADYKLIWGADRENKKLKNIETTYEVLSRILELIAELERNFAKQNFILVSHGDPLKILQAWFENKSLGEHVDLHFKNSEYRKLNNIASN